MMLANSGEIALAVNPEPTPERNASTEAKKNILFFLIGPPKVPLPSLRRNTGTFGWKMKLRPVSTLLVWYQPAVPWKWFVPDFVITFTDADEFRPDSAEKLFTETRSSWTASALGLKFDTPPRGLPFTEALSTWKLLDSARWPLAFMFTPYSAEKMSPVAWA